MNGIYLGFLAELDAGITVLMSLSLLGAAMLLVLLALAHVSDRAGAARTLVPLPVVLLPRARRRGEVRVHLDEMLRACGATRAPPPASLAPISAQPLPPPQTQISDAILSRMRR